MRIASFVAAAPSPLLQPDQIAFSDPFSVTYRHVRHQASGLILRTFKVKYTGVGDGEGGAT